MKKRYGILVLFAMLIFLLIPAQKTYAQTTDTTYDYLAIGNSITTHPIKSFWWGDWGMAATRPENDFVHQVDSYLRQYNDSVSTKALYYVAWEDSSSKSSQLYLLDSYLNTNLDLVTIQLGENISNNTNADAELRNLIAYVQQRAPKAQIILVGSFWENNLTFDSVKRNVAASMGFEYIDLSSIRSWRVGVGSVVSGADGKQHVITSQAVGEHPNDAAMKYIADRITEKIYNPSAIDYSAVYDYEHYLAYNPDVAAVYANNPAGAFRHFLQFGMAEGRRASREFDLATYKNTYADLRAIYGNDNKQYYLHYIKYGKAEGRSAYSSAAGITALNGVDYSAVYNYEYYIQQNKDVAAAFPNDDLGALKHFVNCGMAEGRQASAGFNVQAYRAQNKDLRQTFGNDLKQYYLHYMMFGKNEGRKATGSTTITDGITVYNGVDYSAVYNYQYYIQQNKDVAAAYPNDDVTTLAHFVNCGMNEGRVASAGFNVHAYRAQYLDLRQIYGNNVIQYYLHYMMFGKSEGRKATGSTIITTGITVYNGVDYSAVYNYQYYIQQNKDVAAAYPNDDVAALAHFVNVGMNEGRQACQNFNVNVYRANYPDLQAVYGNSQAQYYLHYMLFGKNEGRNAAALVNRVAEAKEISEEDIETEESETEAAEPEIVIESTASEDDE